MWIDTLKGEFPVKQKRGQIILKTCPFCGNERWNLEFSIEKRCYHCWVCDSRGTVESFLRLYNLQVDNDEWQSTAQADSSVPQEVLSLETFVPFPYGGYTKFFEAKGLEFADIDRYKLMTALRGKYKGKLVIPLFEGQKFVYMVARDTLIKGGRYYNAQIEKSHLLPFYLGSCNRYCLYLVEGILDAISINKLGFSAGILLGTVINNRQVKKFLEFGFEKAVVCLDGDARKKAIDLYDKLTYRGIDTYWVEFAEKEDPNDVYVRDKAELKRLLLDVKKLTLVDRVGG